MRMPRGTPRRSMLIVLAIMAAIALPICARAQDAEPPEVVKVTVLVDGAPAPAELAELVPLKAGGPYSLAAVDLAVKALYRSGLFSDVRVEKAGEEKVELTFLLSRTLVVRRLIFKGAKVRSSRLKEAVESLREGGAFESDLLAKASDELKEALRREGYFEAVVEASPRRIPKRPNVDILFNVTGTKRYRIASIQLQGPLVLSKADLLKKMKSRLGEYYVPSRLDRDIQALNARYTSLGYPRVDIQLAFEHFQEDTGTAAIDLDIQPHEKIVIVINGAKVSPKLVAPLWQERIFEEWGLSEGEVRILSALRKKGYVLAVVKGRIERPENEVRIIYDVTPGLKYRINKISFAGNTSFTSQQLKAELVVSERVLFFSSISYDRLFALPPDIEYFYQTHGFPDARVELDLQKAEKGVDAVYRINEGGEQKIASISLEGASLFPARDILKTLVDTAGGPLFQPNLQRDVGIIESFYLNHGVRGTRVTSRLVPAGTNRVQVVFDIEEGTPVTIRNILITGNRTTRMSVIKREIKVHKGGPADLSLIQDTKRRLERLGIFSDVRTEEVMTDAKDENLVLTVQEGEQNYAGAGFGFETSAVGSPSAGQNQYSPKVSGEYIRTNVLGLGAQLSFIGQYSLLERRVVGSWTQPYLFGLPLQPSLLGWVEREDMIFYTFNRRGVSFNLTRPLGRHLLLITTLSWSRTELTKVDILPSEIDRRFQPFATALASVSLVMDRRDDTLNPTKGFFFSAVGQVATPVFGTESDYWKTFFKFQYFRPFLSQLDFDVTARLGLCQGLIAIPERFFAGGSSSFRGRGFDNLGPKDPTTGNPVGGRALFLVNTELQFPLLLSFKDLSGVIFYDVGNVFSAISAFRIKDFEGAMGLGLRYRTPLGPVRLEVAWNLDNPERRGRPLLFFTIGNVF